MSRRQQDEARAAVILAALDTPRERAKIRVGIAQAQAYANHPSHMRLPRPPIEPAPWSPTPDYAAHAAPPNRSMLRDLVVALVRKVIR